MIRIVGNWEIGWNSPIMEHRQWYYLMKEFTVDEWIMSPKTGVETQKVIEVSQASKYLKNIKDSTIVYVDENGTIELPDFEHPENVTYVFGKAGFSIWKSMGSPEPSVKIPTINNVGGFWAHQALAIILYDRYLKEGS